MVASLEQRNEFVHAPSGYRRRPLPFITIPGARRLVSLPQDDHRSHYCERFGPERGKVFVPRRILGPTTAKFSSRDQFWAQHWQSFRPAINICPNIVSFFTPRPMLGPKSPLFSSPRPFWAKNRLDSHPCNGS